MGNKEVSSDVQAVVSMYCISDVSTWSQTKDLTNIIGNGKDPSTMLLGENYTAEQALAASPITYVSSKTVPMFVGHGKNDTLVGCEQSITLSEKLKENIDPELVDTYFEPSDALWRGIGVIAGSGRKLRPEYAKFDAGSDHLMEDQKKNQACRCDQVLMGKALPGNCPLFGTVCTPMNPQGACMVSEEGSCHQYLMYHRTR